MKEKGTEPARLKTISARAALTNHMKVTKRVGGRRAKSHGVISDTSSNVSLPLAQGSTQTFSVR